MAKNGAHDKKCVLFFCAQTQKGAMTMAVFRIEKTQNYTVMSNHHLHNIYLHLDSEDKRAAANSLASVAM